MSENVICPAEDYTFKSKSIVFGWTYNIFAHMSSQRLYLNSLFFLVYIFQIIKYNMADAHSAGVKSELMKFGTLSLQKMFEYQSKAGDQFTFTLSHSLTLFILNNFCFHVYAQKSDSLC